jgi:hypothetical protein
MQRGWRAAAVAAVLGVGGAASAHELTCLKLANDEPVTSVERYPTTVEFLYRIDNVHPSATSVATSAEDPLLEGRGFVFGQALPLALGVGQHTVSRFSVRLESYEACLELARSDGRDDSHFDSDFRVTWELGATQCRARLTCEKRPDSGPTVLPPPTRDEGFFKTHEQAVGACLASGPVALGALGRVTTVARALGLLWGSPELHEDGRARTAGDSLRFDVGRQLLVATCNARLFGGQPGDTGLLERAREALSGRDCQGLREVRQGLEAFSGSGTREPVPAGFDAGPSAPVRARALADDFTRPSGLGCDGAGSR